MFQDIAVTIVVFNVNLSTDLSSIHFYPYLIYNDRDNKKNYK